MQQATRFPSITLLITHFNRSQSLERLLATFNQQKVSFGSIVVSDDSSNDEHQIVLEYLRDKYGFALVTTPQNKGLGNNINKGQDTIITPYTLYVQEDFEPKPAFSQQLVLALNYMEKDEGIDIARFYAYFSYPYKKPYGAGFAEMVYRPQLWANNHLKFYMYSDHPHLRRKSFFNKFGRYKEGVKGDITESSMAKSFIQKKGRGIFFENFDELFYQKNSASEPSTMSRATWRSSKNVLALALRYVYLQAKLLRWTFEVRQRQVSE